MSHHLSDQSENIRTLMPRQGPSVILNDVSNWLMLASTPLLVADLYAGISGQHVPPGIYKGSAVAMVAGAGWGLMEGLKEASLLDKYREASLREMSALRFQSDSQQKLLESMQQQLASHHSDKPHSATSGHAHHGRINEMLAQEKQR